MYPASKTFKLVAFAAQATSGYELYDCSVVFNQQDFPEATNGDLVELWQLDCEQNRVIFQARVWKDSPQLPSLASLCIGISDKVAKKMKLKLNCQTLASIIRRDDVAIDLLEITFREQYFSRGDMWRVRKCLVNSCVHLDQRLEIYKFMKVTVCEIWLKGERVKCGCVTESTRVTFRSLTAQVNIFIQMSSEMWDFDRFGYLYFEKTVDGFLVDLFNLWKKNQCNHDVTITLFSRVFYDAQSLNDFPEAIQGNISVDSRGRFYEDFYRVVVQNERSEDWMKSKTLNLLKTLFQQYDQSVFHYHETGPQGLLKRERENETLKEWNPTAGCGKAATQCKETAMQWPKIPAARNSTAADGNVLEVLNLALNVYEKYHIDRSFDRTGKLSIVLTPGTGVFEVDRWLANITKQRTIDCGISSDLVCLADQPLHAVPLFRYHSRGMPDSCIDYNIPHWISHSFYTWPSHIVMYGKAERFVDIPKQQNPENRATSSGAKSQQQLFIPTEKRDQIDYDGYDEQVFRIAPVKDSVSSLNVKGIECQLKHSPRQPPLTVYFKHFLDNLQPGDELDLGIENMSHSFKVRRLQPLSVQTKPSSFKLPFLHHRVGQETFNKPLINPFAASKLHFKVTANRRRWAHAFPMDNKGKTVQLHHQPRIESDASGTSPATPRDVQATMADPRARSHKRSSGRRFSECSDASGIVSRTVINGSGSPRDAAREVNIGITKAIAIRRDNDRTYSEAACGSVGASFVVGSASSAGNWGPSARSRIAAAANSMMSDAHNWCWGATGEQEWTIELRTLMDWKSLTVPAILPMTTDFFPDKRSLDSAYTTHNYTVDPEVLCIDLTPIPGRDRKMTARVAFEEMILQRLAQGFQIVVPSKQPVYRATSSSIRLSNSGIPTAENVLSIGSVFHILSFIEPTVFVKIYTPIYKFEGSEYSYKYRFRVPDSDGGFDASETKFTCEPRERFRWNYVDQYLGSCGEDRNFGLIDPMKYWRTRFFLLPVIAAATLSTSSLSRCDTYGFRNPFNHVLALEGLLRFLELANKLRRINVPTTSRRDQLLNHAYVAGAADYVSIFFNIFVDNGNDFLPTASPSKVIRNPTGEKASEHFEAPIIPLSLASPPDMNQNAVDSLLRRAVHEVECGSGAWSTWIASMQGKTGKSLTFGSSKADIVNTMCNPAEGLSFVQISKNASCPPLPEHCFISVEAVLWAINAVEGVSTLKDGIDYMQKLLNDRIICHASGNPDFRFIYGFYLYFVVTSPNTPDADANFEWEWCEVAIKQNTSRSIPAYVAMFMDDPLPLYRYETCLELKRPLHKEVHVEITPDPNLHPETASDRPEYGAAQYHRAYSPDGVFELQVEWMVGTGPFLNELISSWSRKAGTIDMAATANNRGYYMEFLPVPRVPFALPCMTNADPLRAPLFIPLNLSCLCDDSSSEPFHGFSKDSYSERIMLLQCSIADCFGFLRDRPPTPGNVGGIDMTEPWPQYVHCTGNAFIMIPLLGQPCSDHAAESMYSDFISCQSQYVHWGNGSSDHLNRSVGFLWGWNFMLTKRWRTTVTGDELFQDRLLDDFRKFCSGNDGRLAEHWHRARAVSNVFNTFYNIVTHNQKRRTDEV